MPFNVAVVFLGNTGSGKTQTVSRIEAKAKGLEYDNTNRTVETSNANYVVIENVDKIQMQIRDTSGNKFFRTLVPGYCKSVKCVVIMVHPGCQEDLDVAKELLAAVRRSAGEHQPKIILALNEQPRPGELNEMLFQEINDQDFQNDFWDYDKCRINSDTGENIDTLQDWLFEAAAPLNAEGFTDLPPESPKGVVEPASPPEPPKGIVEPTLPLEPPKGLVEPTSPPEAPKRALNGWLIALTVLTGVIPALIALSIFAKAKHKGVMAYLKDIFYPVQKNNKKPPSGGDGVHEPFVEIGYGDFADPIRTDAPGASAKTPVATNVAPANRHKPTAPDAP